MAEKRQLGKILLRQKLVTPEELELLLKQQHAQPGHRLASTALASGKVNEIELLRALSEQHGLPGIDLTQIVIPLAELRLIPADIAKQHLILPILVREDRIFLAMADPADRKVLDEIEFVTGRKIFPYVALHEHLRTTIERAYVLAENGEAFFVGPRVPADYLESIGLAPEAPAARATVPPEAPRDTSVVRESRAPEPTGDFELSGLHPLPPEESDPPPAQHRPPTQRKRILVIDDEEDIRKLIKRVLVDRSYEVLEAADGLTGLQKIRDEIPDLLLVDAMLPEVHGFDICRRVKGSQKYGHIPIIMVSAIYRGWRFAEDARSSFGVAAFIEKPFRVAELLAAVERALDGRVGPTGTTDPPPNAEAQQVIAEALRKYQAGDVDGAVRTLRAATRVDPLSFALHYQLGLVCGRSELLFDAIHALETAVELRPRHYSALKNLALMHQKAGFRHRSIEMWERALACAPSDDIRQSIKALLVEML